VTRTVWNYTPDLPIRSAPFLHWPLEPKKIARYLLRAWKPLTPRIFMLAVAFGIWAWLMPAASAAESLSPGWVAGVWLRNLLLVAVVAGGVHVWLYRWGRQGEGLRYDARPLGRNKRKFLFGDQVKDNMFLTLASAVAVWTLAESAVLWAYANGVAPRLHWEADPVWFVVLLAAVPYWSYTWFSVTHRLLHFGPVYRRVHSWHHRNDNLGPWSGLAMHPLEHVVLFGDVVILLLLPSHPVHLYFMLMHHGLGAPLSHTGYDALLLGRRLRFEFGDFHHQLHHRFVECNYGTPDIPLDDMIGSWHDGGPEGDRRIAERIRQRTESRSG